MSSWTDSYSTTPALAEAVGDAALVRRMLDFEAALARALEQAGVAPTGSGETIATACGGLARTIDHASLFAEGATAGTLAIPLVKRLTEFVRARDPGASIWVHFGATSQDVMDSAMILQVAEAVELIEADVVRLCTASARLAQSHRRSFMLGRTLLQPATPIPFGLKAAQWLSSSLDCLVRLRRAASEALVVQFGGAAGTLGSLGRKAVATASNLNALFAPVGSQTIGEALVTPWHTRRDRLLSLASEFSILTASCAKMARDVSLMMQFEVSETIEPAAAGRGGSSAMPHKRNPVLCMFTLSAGVRSPHLLATLLGAMIQEHERALGGWQAEWSAFPELIKLAGGAAANMAETLSGLQVDARRMRENLDALRGLPMTEMVSLALAAKIGRAEAHSAVEAASRQVGAEGITLADALMANSQVNRCFARSDIEGLLDPEAAQGAAQSFIDVALARWATVEPRQRQNG